MKFNQCLYTYLDTHYDLSSTEKMLLMVGLVLVCIIIPYLIGSINFAMVVSKIKYKNDIRKYGSGNAGTTNMLRTYGKGAAIVTLLGDMAKAAIAVTLGAFLWVDGAFIAGLFCVIGHIFPCWFNFKGGKGIAPTAMVILLTSPPTFLILIIIFAIIVIGTKYVSLGSVMCALLYPLLLSRFGGVGINVIMAFMITILVVVMHRGNIKRIINRTESKISFSKAKKNNAEASDKVVINSGEEKSEK
jgi:glycerol-3-phosphate acyltransferase PlsY